MSKPNTRAYVIKEVIPARNAAKKPSYEYGFPTTLLQASLRQPALNTPAGSLSFRPGGRQLIALPAHGMKPGNIARVPPEFLCETRTIFRRLSIHTAGQANRANAKVVGSGMTVCRNNTSSTASRLLRPVSCVSRSSSAASVKPPWPVTMRVWPLAAMSLKPDASVAPPAISSHRTECPKPFPSA